mmetsp:Transcript_16842/g.41562  ORF Transcript_16842/g.41562 Transcript_16842/m.41562 type:complete len:245 (-) Transcript_16842:833-1567(-)
MQPLASRRPLHRRTYQRRCQLLCPTRTNPLSCSHRSLPVCYVKRSWYVVPLAPLPPPLHPPQLPLPRDGTAEPQGYPPTRAQPASRLALGSLRTTRCDCSSPAPPPRGASSTRSASGLPCQSNPRSCCRRRRRRSHRLRTLRRAFSPRAPCWPSASPLPGRGLTAPARLLRCGLDRASTPPPLLPPSPRNLGQRPPPPPFPSPPLLPPTPPPCGAPVWSAPPPRPPGAHAGANVPRRAQAPETL